MKALPRSSGLLFSLVLLMAVVPDRAAWPSERIQYLPWVVPATVSASGIDGLPLELAGSRPTYRAEPFRSIVPSTPELLTPDPTPTPLPAGPIPELPAILRDDHLAALRAARRAIATPPTVQASAIISLTEIGPVVVSSVVISPSVSTPVVKIPAVMASTRPSDHFDVYVHLPQSAVQGKPLRVLLVLHGMGGRGDIFAEPLVAEAERDGWLVVAPTLPYKADYLDPAQLVKEDLELSQDLHTMLDELPTRLDLSLRRRVMILGFSRGAQLAHRFAFFHPEHVESVAAISAGSYTMPLVKSSDKVLNFPFGVGDLTQRLGAPVDWDLFKKVSFWVAVGAKDNRPDEVARAFDPYCGNTRVERAKAFEQALHDLGMNAQLTVFPNADHEVTAEMSSQALKFLHEAELSDKSED
jgi:pimeloyl-ACP methyl ester carboxylesterase